LEGRAAVEVDSFSWLTARGGGDGDVDRAFDGFEELPKDRGGGVAEDSTLAAGKNGGHEAPVQAQAPVAHGVDTSVDAVEAAFPKGSGDRVLAYANLTKLTRGDDPVLTCGNSCQLSPRGVAFFPHGWE
jgi:hypothetical protein